jgi:ketosteroid isomerase-like protein
MSLGSLEMDLQRAVAVTDEEAAAMRTGDFARYLAILSDDALFLPPNSKPMEGNELREWLRDFVERFTVEWRTFVHEEAVAVADLAYHRYSYCWTVTPKSGGAPTLARGKGMHILRRQADGAWKMSRNIWNAAPAPPQSR